MSINLPNLPRTSTPDRSRMRGLTPVKMMDPATSGFIEILVSTDCAPTLDRLLPPEGQAALARLIAAHPEISKTLAEVEGGHDKQLSYRGLVVNFWDTRSLGHIIIYHLEKEDDTPPSGPPDKKTNPYWKIAIGAAISAAVREVSKRFPDIFQRGNIPRPRICLTTTTRPSRRSQPNVFKWNSVPGHVGVCTNKNLYALLTLAYTLTLVSRGNPASLQKYGPVFAMKGRLGVELLPMHSGEAGCGVIPSGVRWYVVAAVLCDKYNIQPIAVTAQSYPNTSAYFIPLSIGRDNFDGITFRRGIGMLNSATDRTVALRKAIAELRAHIAGTQPLRGFTVLEKPTVDVHAVRVLAKCSPQRLAALLQISIDQLIAWECGEAHPNSDQVRLLSLMEFYPEKVIHELEMAESSGHHLH